MAAVRSHVNMNARGSSLSSLTMLSDPHADAQLFLEPGMFREGGSCLDRGLEAPLAVWKRRRRRRPLEIYVDASEDLEGVAPEDRPKSGSPTRRP